MNYTQEEITLANKTSRNSQAIGERAVVPRLVRSYLTKDMTVLDFGAGKSAAHTLKFKEEGYNVTAYDFGENCVIGIHDETALHRTYDLVYASNVLNVQSNYRMLDNTIACIKSVMKPDAILIANYPLSPRKIEMSAEDMISYLKLWFPIVNIINDDKSRPVLFIKK